MLNTRSYTAVVVMAIVTSVAAPPMLRAVGRRWAGTEEEQRRLELEQTHASNVLVQPSRLLLPVQPGVCSLVAAKILDLALPETGDAVLVSVAPDGARAAAQVADVFRRRAVTTEHLADVDAADAVVGQVRLGFDVIGVGAWQSRGDEQLLSPLSEAILSRCPVPAVVVWDGEEGRHEARQGFRRVLVPVVSTVANRAAQEVAFGLAAAAGAEVVVTHIDLERSAPVTASVSGGAVRRAEELQSRSRGGVAQGVVDEAADLARRLGVQPTTVVRRGRSRAELISEIARDVDVDLVVLGSELQPVAGETFMGDLVERLIRSVDCSVAVVAMPRTALGMAEEPYPRG